MKINSTNTYPSDIALVVFCTEESIPENVKDIATRLIEEKRFSPANAGFKIIEREKNPPLILVATSTKATSKYRTLKQVIGKLTRFACEAGILSFAIDLNSLPLGLAREEQLRCIGEGMIEADYRFELYLTEKSTSRLDTVTVVYNELTEMLSSALDGGLALGKSVCAARDMINTTSRQLTPSAFAQIAAKKAKALSLEYECFDKNHLEDLKAFAILNVSEAAQFPPYMVVMRYRGSDNDDVTALVGKGITFDSGGLSIKSKTGMITMHHDMAGAAAVLYAMEQIAISGIKSNVTAIIPLCENMLAENAYRPGDIIPTMNGKTVLITSTDAEGRLILADGITYAIRHENATRIVDIATLTGGAVSSLGNAINAFTTDDQALREALHAACEKSGDEVWEMPLFSEYKKYLKADQADLKNSSMGDCPSMINGALFLQEFTEEKPWLHIDCAGTSWVKKSEGCDSFGATGSGVSLLHQLTLALK